MKKVTFMPGSELAEVRLPPPVATKSVVPEWYKQAQRFIGGKMNFDRGGINKDLKLCVPFMDAMVSGYVIELPCDIYVENRPDGAIDFFWHEEPAPIEMRAKDMATTLPRPPGHGQSMYAWITNWAVITPPGYSMLFTHPLNRFDLPFTTTSGIMDTDQYSNPGQIPFFLKEGFEGTIPAGTPVVQLIPIKRENWESESVPYNKKFLESKAYAVARSLFGGYKNLFWQKKNYN